MDKIDLKEFADHLQKVWFDELFKHGRSYPDYRDGLKDSTRSILTALARASDYKIKPVPAEKISSEVPANYKEGGEQNVTKNLLRMALTNHPLIEATSAVNKKVQIFNRIKGTHTRLRYINLRLTKLGEYVLKYQSQFNTFPSELNQEISKYEYIKTPVPLSLIIPQANLADGYSTKAPNLNLTEVLDALIEHIQKGKQTSTEDLAKHIKGFEIEGKTKVMMTNQSLYDLIERGISKATVLTPIKFNKGPRPNTVEVLIEELPYRKKGRAIERQFELLNRTTVERGGFESFKVLDYSPESSKDAYITLILELKSGFTLEDVYKELYRKTFLRENIVYQNTVLDTEQEKPLTIKSVRDTLNYHYDIGIELRTNAIKEMIKREHEKRDEADLIERLSRKICVAVIGQIIGESDRQRNILVKKYLNNLREIMIKKLTNNITTEEIATEYPHIRHVIDEYAIIFRQISEKVFENTNEESILEVIRNEVPPAFKDSELKKIFNRDYQILYIINKRDNALNVLRNFDGQIKALEERLQLDNIKEELIDELKDLRKVYNHGSDSIRLYALREQEREVRKDALKRASQNLRKMEKNLPVNVIIDKDMNAYVTIDADIEVENIHTVIQATIEDTLIIFNRNGQSYKVPIKEISTNGTNLGDPNNVLAVTFDYFGKYYYVFVTNRGRMIICNRMLTRFKNRVLNIPLAEDEYFVYHNIFHYDLYSYQISIITKTSDNLVKKIELPKLKVKDKLYEFYNLYAGNSVTKRVNSAALVASDNNYLNLWDNEHYYIHYRKGFKRNVSYGEKIVGTTMESFIIHDRIPIYQNKIISDMNMIMNKSNTFNRLSDILIPIDHELMNKRFEGEELILSEVEWVKLLTSPARLNMKLDFQPDEFQINYFKSRLVN